MQPSDEQTVAPPASGRQSQLAWIAFMCFAAGVLVSGWRIVQYHQTPGPFNPSMQGYCDFHNGVYFPSLAFRDGVSPYSVQYAETYPTERPIPFYSPVILALHTPITLLRLQTAEVAYFAVSLVLLLAIAWISVSWSGLDRWRWDVFWIVAAGILLSRSGQQTVFTGYFTFELILGALVALHYGHRKPGLSALGLLLISAKPTYVLPIAGLMLFRGNFKAVALGAVISMLAAALCFGWLAQTRSLAEIREDIEVSQEIHRGDAYELPVNSWTRLDALAVAAKWTDSTPGDLAHLGIMIIILIPSALTLARYHRHVKDDGSASGVSGAIILVTSLIAIYHHVYDAVVLVPPAVAIILASRADWRRVSLVRRRLLVACMLLSAVNYVSSLLVIGLLGLDGLLKQIVTSVNGVGLLIGCAALLVVANQIAGSAIDEAVEDG